MVIMVIMVITVAMAMVMVMVIGLVMAIGGGSSAVGHRRSWLVSWLVVVVGRSSVVACCSLLFPLARRSKEVGGFSQ